MTVDFGSQLADQHKVATAPGHWSAPCSNTECTLHQLSPYIGKLKSSIARDLVTTYSRPGDLVFDPFAGAGTIPLEAVLCGRRAFAADISPYAKVLSRAKLGAPPTLDNAMDKAARALKEAARLPEPDLRSVPAWVRRFFHHHTLNEIVRFASVCRNPGNEFLLACLLGILHHQRPGFLSYPSSHLVPYLRDKNYPRHRFPEMYEYRDLYSRLFEKLLRIYSRVPADIAAGEASFRQSAIENLSVEEPLDCVITSPPYMNALDYGRDNRLRLWFIDPEYSRPIDADKSARQKAFQRAITALARNVEAKLRKGSYCVLVVGEHVTRGFKAHPAEVAQVLMRQHAPSLRLREIIADKIPDVRRSRRNCHGTKKELFLVFKRGSRARISA